MVFVRKVRTRSGATAVQIAKRVAGRDKVLEHIGSAHTPAELETLLLIARDRLNPDQGVLDLGVDQPASPTPFAGTPVVRQTRSRVLIDTLRDVFTRLGFDAVSDEAFFQLVTARIIEPTSMLQSQRVLADVGIDPVHRSTMKRCLKRIQDQDYRDRVATCCLITL